MKVSKIGRNTMLDAFFTVTAGWCFKIYNGAVPLHSEDSIGAAVLLVIITNNGQPGVGLTWETSSDGNISKLTTETWKGVCIAGGNKDFARWCPLAYDGSANVTDNLLQFSVSDTPDSDILVGNPVAVIGATQEVNYFNNSIPEY